MKISKLFHWLYAIVLLLPVFSIGGKMLYVAFNQNAKDSYYGETINETSLTDINYTDMKFEEYYYFDTRTYSGNFNIYLSDIEYIGGDINQNQMDKIINHKYGYFQRTNDYWQTYYRDSINESWTYGNYFTTQYVVVNAKLTTMPTSQYYDFKVINYNDYTYVDNAFYYAVNQINEQPIFAWAKDSFLVEPISYVSELFGLSNTSPLITLLSYWLNMSIIWLCFDIIMYVPLMAHRWLDKGAIE